MLYNLLGNALKFTYQGAVKVNIEFLHHEKLLITKVQDSGIGIQESDLRQLFIFFNCLAKSKDMNRGGMGLGLSISKMITQQLGGEISVTSKPDVGSIFSFKIPINKF